MSHFYKLIFILSLLINSSQSFAQHKPIISDYNPQEVDIVTKVEESEKNILEKNKNESRVVRVNQLKFIYQSIYYNHTMKTSGKIVNNKALDEYLEKIADQIVSKNEDVIQDPFKINVIRSSIINAFASDDGNLFVTIGLLSRIENEAQLAFVLCHELGHYIEKHGLEMVTEQVQIANSQNSRTFFGNESKVAHMHSFSQELEMDADETGFELYINAGYSVEEIAGVFDMLTNSPLPVDTSAITLIYPGTEVAISEKYLEEQPPPFNVEDIENDDDDFSTHPSIGTRRSSIESLKLIHKPKAGKKYLAASKEDWLKIKKQAEYYLGDYYLNDLQFYSAYCHSYYLKNKYQDSKNEINALKSWLGIVITQVERLPESYMKYYATYDDGFRLKELSNNIPDELLKISALTGAINLYKSNPYKKEYEDLMYLTLDVVRKNPKKSYLKKGRSKIKKIITHEYIDDLFEEVEDEADEVKVFKQFWDNLDSDWKSSLFDKYLESRNIEKKQNLREGGMVIINPKTLYIDETSITEIDLKESIELSKNLEKNLHNILKKYGVENSIISAEGENATIDRFDEFYNSTILMRQSNLMGKKSNKAPYNLLLSSSKIDSIAQKHQARYISYFGLMTVKQAINNRKLEAALKLYVSYFVGYGIPQVLSSIIFDKHKTYFYTLIYDTQTKEFILNDFTQMKASTNTEANQKYFTQYAIYKLLKDFK